MGESGGTQSLELAQGFLHDVVEFIRVGRTIRQANGDRFVA